MPKARPSRSSPAHDLHLLPPPQKLRRAHGQLPLAALDTIALPPRPSAGERVLFEQLAGALTSRIGRAPRLAATGEPATIRLDRADAPGAPAQSYRLRIDTTSATIVGADAAGLYYGVQTLRQLVAGEADSLPALTIDDAPDYPARGFYHDITRGKVPTRATLFALVEKMAHYKLNQLQLYVEHTYAFHRHPDIWAGADPLTADDIRALDEHCARHHVELVPSLSTFGHFYTALVSPRKQHLNELPVDGSRLPFSWWDRMGHYTLDCLNPESLALVRELILEFRPLFRSRLFNICCDETFDLGKGRNAAAAAERGVGRLYVDFLRQIMAVVREADAVPMFWGDIVGQHPELVGELPADAIALDWDYSADLRDTQSALFRRARIPFYVCPGVSGWDRWMNDLNTATANILGFARRGRRDGAIGLLNTDWGDCGHVNALGHSYHGMILGASAAWNVRATQPEPFDRAFAARELGDAASPVPALLRAIGSAPVVRWRLLTLWIDPSPHRPASWWDERTGIPDGILKLDPKAVFAAAARLAGLEKQLAAALRRTPPGDPLLARELLAGTRVTRLLQALGGWLIHYGTGAPVPSGALPAAVVSADLRRAEAEVSEIWHARNRPSEYWRVKQALLEFARRLDRFALGLPPLKTPRGAVP